MKGNPKVLRILNDVLTAELTAINQYFVHAKMCENWGYLKLNKILRTEAIDEMRHADTVIDRILYLEGTPNMTRLHEIRVGKTFAQMLRSDLALEKKAIERLNKGIPLARESGDNGTAELLATILVNEEEHLDWIEAQLELIGQVGIENYLAQQLGPDGGAA
jgi:bacterioferritin